MGSAQTGDKFIRRPGGRLRSTPEKLQWLKELGCSEVVVYCVRSDSVGRSLKTNNFVGIRLTIVIVASREYLEISN
jgi:hypothetical protein